MNPQPRRLKNVWKKPRQVYELEKLKNKGMTYRISVLEPKQWKRLVSSDPSIPRSFGQLRELSRKLFDTNRRADLRQMQWDYQPDRGLLDSGVEECGESAHAAFFAGLSNPFLTDQQRAALEDDIDADTPGFENQHETAHFIVNWTTTSTNLADNLTDGAVATEVAGHLEAAWDRYTTTFGRSPYVPAGRSKIEVVFQDIAGFGVASPPDGPIKFDSTAFQNNPGIRRPTSAHELFHKLQYAYGYRRTYSPVSPYKWFSEGSASWAEVFMWGQVSGSYKITDLFATPATALFDASYRALPFWVFFDARQKSDPTDFPVRNFLEKYELHGIEEQALGEAIADEWAPNNVHNNLAGLFALFCRERTWNSWKRGPTGNVYNDILGPDGTVIAPNLLVTDVNMSSGDSYSNGGYVNPSGADYYLLRLGPSADTRTLTMTVDAAVGADFVYYQVWQHNGAFRQGRFPFGVSEDYSFSEAIDRAQANELMLIVAGRDNGGGYTLNASVS